jgi:hypothetical protein
VFSVRREVVPFKRIQNSEDVRLNCGSVEDY